MAKTPLEVLSEQAIAIANAKEEIGAHEQTFRAAIGTVVDSAQAQLEKVTEITKVAQGTDEKAKKIKEKLGLEKQLKDIEDGKRQ